jgi:hypothetical protein
MKSGDAMKQTSADNKGNIILELALILPVIMLISFASLEVARAFDHWEAASILSREIARTVFQECSGRSDAQNCLDVAESKYGNQTLRQQIEGFARRLMPDARLVVSIYKYDPATSTYSRLALSPSTADPDITMSRPYVSKFDLDGNSFEYPSVPTGSTSVDDVLKASRVIVIGEAFIPYAPVIGPISFGWLTFRNPTGRIGQFFYDVTVI